MKRNALRWPTYREQLQRYVQQYRDSGMPWPAQSKDIAAWAINRGLWAPTPSAVLRMCADAFADAMREEYITDPQGRTVRAKHAARVKRGDEQLTLWADIRTADPTHMAIAFQNRREQIVGDCRQLHLDVESYNENAKPPKHLQFRLVLDFTEDVREAEAVAAAA